MRDACAPPARRKTDVAGQAEIICQSCYEPMSETVGGRVAYRATCGELQRWPEIVPRWWCGCDGLEPALHFTVSSSPPGTVH